MPHRRFMVLATARTGSNLLLSLLSGHPAIKAYGELFKLDALPTESLREALDDPIAYLHRRLHKVPRGGVAAVGFKMFYHHVTMEHVQMLGTVAAFIDEHYDRAALEQRFREAWNHLIADHDLAVIHLKRRNMLDTLISLKTALQTQQWWSLARHGKASTTLYLDPEECRQFFDRLEVLVANTDDAFARHPKIEVVYEDLVAQREAVLSSVFEFLSVPSRPVTTLMTKQRSAPASEIVANYRELKDRCLNTKWASFFV